MDGRTRGVRTRGVRTRVAETQTAGWLWLFLVISLAVVMSLLTGCGKNGDGTGIAGQTEAGSENEGTAGEETEAPKGRYAEKSMELPFDPAEEFMQNMLVSPEGELVVLTYDMEERYRVYRWKELEGWKQDDTIPDLIPKGSILLKLAYAGTDIYILARDDTGRYVGKSEDGGPFERLDNSFFEQEMVGNIADFLVDADGTVLLSLMEGKTVICGPDGAGSLSISQKARSSTRNTSSVLIGDTYITAGERDFSVFDIKTGTQLESIPYQTGVSDVEGSLATGGELDLYLCNPAGIHHMTLNGTMWETVVDGNLNSLGLPGIKINKLCIGAEKDYFVWFESGEQTSLVHYVFDPYIPSVPSETLTVYGLDMGTCKLVRQGAIRYQMENPNVRVEIIDGKEQMEGMTDGDIIRSLNAELLSGMGADVLVLDGLPAQAYKEKGILADMKEVLDPLISEELYSNLTHGFIEEDGAVYEMPVRILFPVIYGETAAIQSFAGPEVFNEYQNSPEAGAIRGKTVYENILRQLSFLYYGDLWEDNSETLNTDAVRLLLENAMQTGNNCGAQPVFDTAFDDGAGENYNRISENGFTDPDYLNLMAGETVVSLELPQGMEAMSLPFAVMKEKNYGFYPINSSFYPIERVSVNQNSGRREMAEQFVRFLLSEKIQGEDVEDGFPVSRAGISAWEEREISMTYGAGSWDGLMVYGEYPDEDERKQILGLIPELKNPVIPDPAVLSILTVESAAWFAGDQDLESTVNKIENKVLLYLAERE